jgi:glycosyltransferase involved in cell wall biosynthesis
MSNPLVSILIPAHNAERWIQGAMTSACLQTWPNKEIIVINDGSLDSTLNIANRVAWDLPNVKVFSQPNRGAAAARNHAFSRCKGDYIQWLDADDLLDKDKIHEQMNVINWMKLSPKTLLSGSWAHFRYCTSRADFLRAGDGLCANLTPHEWLLRKLGRNLHMQTANWLVSRELTEAAGPWNTAMISDDDGEYFCRVLLKSDGVRFVPHARSYYRTTSAGSLSKLRGDSKKLEALLVSMNLHIEYIRSLDDGQATRNACLYYIKTWLHEFYPYRPDLVALLKELTHELGGTFEEPRLPAKYQWIKEQFGWHAARKAQILLPKVRHSASIGWDRLLWQIGVP